METFNSVQEEEDGIITSGQTMVGDGRRGEDESDSSLLTDGMSTKNKSIKAAIVRKGRK